ncbi:MAG: DUF3089 domain-containing protein [Burkholderiaceae bacterium]|jgi:hypothetical protein|nr:DUF3089 domain-containing protein [Burkholderiaceae bacterium]
MAGLRHKWLLPIFCFLFITGACGNVVAEEYALPVQGDNIKPVDYSDSRNWLSLPDGKDTAVDVFFIYPTAWERDKGAYPIADIDHAGMRQGAVLDLKTRASVFRTIGNIYAPYYRQLDAPYSLERTEKGDDAMKYFLGVPLTDIRAAFEYYIAHYNKGRPFILLGHSQGAIMIHGLLGDYMKKHRSVYSRMIAAYAIGYPLTQDGYDKHPHLKPAMGEADTGVIISYNTEAPNVEGKSPFVKPGAVTINPVSWTRTTEIVPKSKSRGSIIVRDDGTFTVAKQLADATINPERGTIICTTVDTEKFSSDPSWRAYFPRGVFHTNDIPLYYFDLRHNAEVRVKAYFDALKQN